MRVERGGMRAGTANTMRPMTPGCFRIQSSNKADHLLRVGTLSAPAARTRRTRASRIRWRRDAQQGFDALRQNLVASAHSRLSDGSSSARARFGSGSATTSALRMTPVCEAPRSAGRARSVNSMPALAAAVAVMVRAFQPVKNRVEVAFREHRICSGPNGAVLVAAAGSRERRRIHTTILPRASRRAAGAKAVVTSLGGLEHGFRMGSSRPSPSSYTRAATVASVSVENCPFIRQGESCAAWLVVLLYKAWPPRSFPVARNDGFGGLFAARVGMQYTQPTVEGGRWLRNLAKLLLVGVLLASGGVLLPGCAGETRRAPLDLPGKPYPC